MAEDATTYTQQEYLLNENAKIFRLGYTVEAVQAIIAAGGTAATEG